MKKGCGKPHPYFTSPEREAELWGRLGVKAEALAG